MNLLAFDLSGRARIILRRLSCSRKHTRFAGRDKGFY
jgi:hypothetical protein